jgi:hypothetical protein
MSQYLRSTAGVDKLGAPYQSAHTVSRFLSHSLMVYENAFTISMFIVYLLGTSFGVSYRVR